MPPTVRVLSVFAAEQARLMARLREQLDVDNQSTSSTEITEDEKSS